jgi:tetratricopeptide (TPR) repeat protein
MIPYIYLWLDQSDKASEFLFKNKNMICEDSGYECVNVWRLKEYSQIFYDSYHYNEAVEIIEVMLNRSESELAYEGEKNDDVKVPFYFKSGMIHMKRGNLDMAIDSYNNALKIIEQSDETWEWWLLTLHEKLGFTYYYNNDFKNASSYFQKSISIYNTCYECQEESSVISAKCYYGLLKLLTVNLDTSEQAIHTSESWLKEHPLNKDDNYDYHAYSLYWPLYLYYDKLNQSDKATKYLEMAYDIVGKEKIEKYNKHPEKNTHPEFFYCRDIIKAYESSLNQ